MCSKATKNSANKVFIYKPHDLKRRKLWLELTRCNLKDYSEKSTSLFMCEDKTANNYSNDIPLLRYVRVLYFSLKLYEKLYHV